MKYMPLPTVSVIIPTYNRADFLARAVKSVLNQSFKNFELIIVDDGSTDNTGETAKRFQKEDSRVKYVWQKNSGTPASSQNTGIRNARGEYVAFLDDDDEWLRNKLEKQIALFQNSKKQNLGIVGCGSFIIKNDKAAIYKFSKIENILKSLLEKSVFMSNSATVIKNDVFAKVGLFDEKFKLFSNRDMWLKICLEYGFDFVDEPLYRYYVHTGNISRKHPLLEAIEIEYLIKKWRVYYEKFPGILAMQLKTVGTIYALNNDIKSARKYFASAVWAAPWRLKNYISLFVSLFGRKICKETLLMKKKLTKMKTRNKRNQ